MTSAEPGLDRSFSVAMDVFTSMSHVVAACVEQLLWLPTAAWASCAEPRARAQGQAERSSTLSAGAYMPAWGYHPGAGIPMPPGRGVAATLLGSWQRLNVYATHARVCSRVCCHGSGVACPRALRGVCDPWYEGVHACRGPRRSHSLRTVRALPGVHAYAKTPTLSVPRVRRRCVRALAIRGVQSPWCAARAAVAFGATIGQSTPRSVCQGCSSCELPIR